MACVSFGLRELPTVRGQKEMKKSDERRKDDAQQEARRRFLKKAGKLAIYTPPAMLVLMQPDIGRASSPGGMTQIDPPG